MSHAFDPQQLERNMDVRSRRCCIHFEGTWTVKNKSNDSNSSSSHIGRASRRMAPSMEISNESKEFCENNREQREDLREQPIMSTDFPWVKVPSSKKEEKKSRK